MANTQKVMTLADTARLIAKVHKDATGGAAFEYDTSAGEYGNLAAYFDAHRDGKVYGVRFPKWTYSNTPSGTKTRDNANLAIEVSTNDKAGRDDYSGLNAFRVWDVNATIGDDGKPHVTAIDGVDTRFKRDGTNGDVWVMTCPCYYKVEQTNTIWSSCIPTPSGTDTCPCPEACCPTAPAAPASCSRNTRPTSPRTTSP